MSSLVGRTMSALGAGVATAAIVYSAVSLTGLVLPPDVGTSVADAALTCPATGCAASSCHHAAPPAASGE